MRIRGTMRFHDMRAARISHRHIMRHRRGPAQKRNSEEHDEQRFQGGDHGTEDRLPPPGMVKTAVPVFFWREALTLQPLEAPYDDDPSPKEPLSCPPPQAATPFRPAILSVE
jgi:hypothetical protein